MRKWTRVIGALMCAVAVNAPGALAQEESLDVRLARAGGLKADTVNAFFDSMRKSFGTNNHHAVCAMVAYPLQQPGGAVTDAASCEARYDEIFTISVRRAVGKQLFNELFVDTKGILIGRGELWFNGTCRDAACREGDFRIIDVNGRPDAGLRPPKGKTLLACRVAGQALRVTADGNGSAEFRLWRGGAPSGPPFVEVLRPTPVPGASPSCSGRAWIFTDQSNEYTVSELDCATLNEMPAMGTVGEVTLRRAGAEVTRAWCFE